MSHPPKFKVPHTLVLLFGLVLVAQVATYVLPQGEFERVPSPSNPNRTEVVPGSYERLDEPVRLPFHAAFTSLFEGFDRGAHVIFFILIVGGMFAVLRETGAVDSLIGWLIDALAGKPSWLIAGGLFLFAAGSSTIGMAEEYIPFVPVLVILCVGLGYDAVVALGILCIGYGTGYGVATVNPFTVLIAQPIAGVAPSSGWEYRLVLAIPFLALGFQHVASYARRVRDDPTKSLVHGLDVAVEHDGTHPPITSRHVGVLLTLAATLVAMVVFIKLYEWYMIELGALFLGLTIAIAAIGGIGPSRAAARFCHGASELASTGLMIAFAYTITVVLENGKVIDTVIHGISLPLQQVGAHAAAAGMFVVQSLCNLFVPSGSGQAYVTMPIMAPLSDLVGVSRQTAVLAYQFGDGFTNIVVPTNAVLVGILAMAGVPYDRWLKFVLPWMLKVWVLATIALVVAVSIGYR